MKKTTLRSKLIGMALISIIALCGLFAVQLGHQKDQLLSDRKEKIRNLVEYAHSQLAALDEQVKGGTLTLAQAQAQAKDALRAARYGGKEYFWVSDYSMTNLVNGFNSKMEGKDLSALKDADGKLISVEFVKTARAYGAGYVDYKWPRAGSELPIAKLTYVKGYEPWGWIIGTGVYIDDIDARFRESTFQFLLWGLAIGGFIALSLGGLLRDIVRTLGGEPADANEITRRIALGDLATEVICRPGDNSSLLAGIRTMQDTLRKMIGAVISDAGQVAAAADELMKTSGGVAERARQQSDAASAMATYVQRMAVGIDQVKDSAREAHSLAREAGDNSEQGASVIHSAASEIRTISQVVQASSTVVEELGQQSAQITSIVKTIKDIADQTNLLALNAAIEAARAGEQGRGFAVVADEVRKLAERTGQSTAEIGGMIARIQAGTRSAVESMQAGVAQVGSGVKLASEAGVSINRIRDGAQRVSHVVDDISQAIDEQSVASSQVAQQLEQIAQMSDDTALAIRQTADSANRLHLLSHSLHAAVAQFKI